MFREPKKFHIGNSALKCRQIAVIFNALRPADDDDLECILRQRVRHKTTEQRNLWHALLIEWGAELGYTARESTTIFKDWVKIELLGSKEIRVGDSVHLVPLSSESCDRYDYSTLIDQTIALAASHGYVIGA